jgi:hypothetical protein
MLASTRNPFSGKKARIVRAFVGDSTTTKRFMGDKKVRGDKETEMRCER